MVFGAILAAGLSSRIKNTDIPKQFVELKGKPVLIYTMEKMLGITRFDYIYIAVHADWREYTQKLILNHFGRDPRIRLALGGADRLSSIINVCRAMINDMDLRPEDVVVIHDAARPFVTEKILNDNIDCAMEHGAVVTALPVSDTILHSADKMTVSDIPKRDLIFHGQTPDSFNLKQFLEVLDGLTGEEKRAITGTSNIYHLKKIPIYMVEGDTLNFKITTDSDLVIADNVVANEKSGKRIIRK